MILDADWAWLAGLLEGEGHFRAQQLRTGRPCLRVYVKMTDRDVVERAAVLMQAPSVRALKPVAEHKQAYEATANGAAAQRVMERVRPWMGVRRGAKIDQLLAIPDLSHHPRRVVS